MPSDETDDLIRDLKNGDDSQILEGEDDGKSNSAGAADTAPRVIEPTLDVPKVVQRVLESPRKQELVGVAMFLDPDNSKKLTLIFHTPIGDVRCAVNWSSNAPDKLSKADQLLLIQVRSSESMFAPAPGADFEISFDGYPGRLKVTCLADPQALYPGIDLLCFLPHNALMEKQGVVQDGAPSVVSGKPSDHVDEAGEPVAGQEKSAGAVTLPPSGSPPRGSDVPSGVIDEVEDFDKPREG